MDKTDKNDIALIHTEGLDKGIRCAMCTNSIKSERGCDGGCVVNNAMYKEVMAVIENHIVDTDKMVEPTTKNNLEVDCNNCKNNFHRGDGSSYCATGDGMCHYECEEPTTKNDLAVDCIVDVLGSYTDLDIPYKREIAENILTKLSSVTPQKPKTGHWKYFQNEKGDWMNICSNCNSDCGVGYPYNYCPNCGCRMER